MKRKKNFFLVLWMAVFFGLSFLVLPAHAENEVYGIKYVSLFHNGVWTYTDPGEFSPESLTYKANISAALSTESDTVYLAVTFDRTQTNNTPALSVEVEIGGNRVYGKNGSQHYGHKAYLQGYDSVYVFDKLGSAVGSKTAGTLTLKYNGSVAAGPFTLELTRVKNPNIANLKKLFVDSLKTGTLSTRGESESFNPTFDAKSLRGSYSDTLKAVIDSIHVAARFRQLVTPVPSTLSALGVTAVELKHRGDGNKDTIKVTGIKSKATAADTAAVALEIQKLVSQAVGEASSDTLAKKEYRLNYELSDPLATDTIIIEGGTGTTTNEGNKFQSWVSIKPGYTYTIKVTSQGKDSVGIFTFEAQSKVVYDDDSKKLDPVVKIGDDANTPPVVINPPDPGSSGSVYGPRVDSIWLESSNGVGFGVSGFREDSLDYTVGVSAKHSGYTLAHKTTSSEPELNFKTFTLLDEEGNFYYQLNVYLLKQLKKTYTVRTYFLDNSTVLKKIVLSSDRDGKNVVDSWDSVKVLDTYQAFKPVEHDVDSVYLHIYSDTLTEVSITEGKSAIPAVSTNKSLDIFQIGNRDTKLTEGTPQYFSVILTAQDQSSAEYKVRIDKSYNLTIEDVKFGVVQGDDYKTDPKFDSRLDPDSVIYTVFVPAGVDFDDVKTVNLQYASSSGIVSSNPILKYSADGRVEYVIKVSVPGSPGEKSYTFHFTHPGSIATLRLLDVSPGDFDRPFVPEDTFYTVTLPSRENMIAVVAFPTDNMATVSGIVGFTNGVGAHSLTKAVDTLTLTVTAADGVKKQDYRIAVINGDPTGIASVANVSNVYVSGGVLYVDTPEAERITVYTAGGQLLSGVSKPAGRISFAGLRGLLIVRGSSGWVKKVLI